MKQHITLLLAAVGILTLAGCVQEDYEPIFVTPSDSESVEEVTEDEGGDSEETEEAVSSEDTNVEETSDEVSEADTQLDLSSETDVELDWVTYTNEEYGLSFSYPNLGGIIEEFSSNCVNDERCFQGKTVGWDYRRAAIDSNRSYTLAAMVTDDYKVDRSTWATDYSGYDYFGGTYNVRSAISSIEVNVKDSGRNDNDLEYILYPLSSVNEIVGGELPDAMVAMFKLPEGHDPDFTHFSVYFESVEALKGIQQVIDSVSLD